MNYSSQQFAWCIPVHLFICPSVHPSIDPYSDLSSMYWCDLDNTICARQWLFLTKRDLQSCQYQKPQTNMNKQTCWFQRYNCKTKQYARLFSSNKRTNKRSLYKHTIIRDRQTYKEREKNRDWQRHREIKKQRERDACFSDSHLKFSHSKSHLRTKMLDRFIVFVERNLHSRHNLQHCPRQSGLWQNNCSDLELWNAGKRRQRSYCVLPRKWRNDVGCSAVGYWRKISYPTLPRKVSFSTKRLCSSCFIPATSMLRLPPSTGFNISAIITEFRRVER